MSIPGLHRVTRAVSVSPKHLPVDCTMTTTVRISSVPTWGLNVPISVLYSTIQAHLGEVKKKKKNAARVFGADRSWSVVVGTSGSNRTIMQACMTDNDVVVLDRKLP
ncbi:Arginine decarboxylase, catabolic [Citrobacter freundii]|uniref:Arginine decarboxylase, catabolic n=1 Tax=Citrobacter freundii TaxID=546 RepID=A0A7G2IUX6_CITFR|nr:Arginine decarboxylase, catabolic [Citrobacter freundii]